MNSNKNSSPPKRASSASAFVPKAVRQLIPEADVAAALGFASEQPVEASKRESAFDAGGVALADIGASLRWVDEAKCEDNPFQTREGYDEGFEGHIEGIEQSFNRVGQLQPGIARPHPDKTRRAAGWLQIGAGHSRLRAVRRGGNAGSNLPDPARFRGKLLVLVRELSDIEMAIIAIEENEARENPNLIERARGFARLQEVLTVAGQGSTWKAFAESRGFTYRRLRQLLDLLELPPKAQKNIAEGYWNEKHGRAVLQLKAEPKLQAMLMRQISNEQLSGNAASARASELWKRIPNQSRLALEEAGKRVQREDAQRGADRAHEENRAALERGEARLRLVDKPEAAADYADAARRLISAEQASRDAQTGTELVALPATAATYPANTRQSGNDELPASARVDDTPAYLRRALFGLAGIRKEIQGTQFEERAHLLELEEALETAIEAAISAREEARVG